MAVPKRKKSKSRVRMRQAQWYASIPQTEGQACAECGAPVQPHRVCASCGKYKGRQVVIKEAAE